MEESFEKKEGVLEVISGYSGGTTEDPNYEEVTYGNTGHFEVVEILFDKSKTNFEELLNHFVVYSLKGISVSDYKNAYFE